MIVLFRVCFQSRCDTVTSEMRFPVDSCCLADAESGLVRSGAPWARRVLYCGRRLVSSSQTDWRLALPRSRRHMHREEKSVCDLVCVSVCLFVFISSLWQLSISRQSVRRRRSRRPQPEDDTDNAVTATTDQQQLGFKLSRQINKTASPPPVGNGACSRTQPRLTHCLF